MRYSIHDGPGIRTTVFFKGCPLNCPWCHNPESHSIKEQVVKYTNKCIGCGKCLEVCPTDAIYVKDNEIYFDAKACNQCSKCVEVCYTGAMEIVGKVMSVDEVMKEIEKDNAFYDESGGGVTFSGGEPFMQHEYLKELLIQCKKRDIHTAIDTSGFVKKEILDDMSDFIDLFLYDLKIMDDKEHIKYIGVSNKLILENLERLVKQNKRIFIRIPIIPDINDGEEHLKDFIEYLISLRGFEQINLLPYHNIATEKYKRLGQDYGLVEIKTPSDEKMMEIQEKFESHGFKVKIGG